MNIHGSLSLVSDEVYDDQPVFIVRKMGFNIPSEDSPDGWLVFDCAVDIKDSGLVLQDDGLQQDDEENGGQRPLGTKTIKQRGSGRPYSRTIY
jgi:hypothetical protein